MRKAEAAGNKDCPVKIKLVAPPLYVLTTQTLDKVRLFEKSKALCTCKMLIASIRLPMFSVAYPCAIKVVKYLIPLT